jgi:hypothetical protein
MSAPAPIVIEAVVADSERPAVVAAGEQLGECLRAASGHRWPVDVRFRPTIVSVAATGRPTLALLSLLPELATPDSSPAQVHARWRAQLSPLAGVVPALFICTIFRHVGRVGDAQSAANADKLERIRRLDLIAAELSHETGVGVIDIDRVFAHVGARDLQADYRLEGRLAAEVAAHGIVGAFLAVGLDDSVPPAVLARAREYQGNLWNIYAYVARRLQASARTGVGAVNG